LIGAGLPAPFALLFAWPLPAAAEALPPPLLLAERYRDGIDVSNYWISEKLDGVRAAWDGRVLRFRSGNPVPAPQWFLDGLPAEALDGELWLGRGRFDELSAIVRRRLRSMRSGGACVTWYSSCPVLPAALPSALRGCKQLRRRRSGPG
jgi:ATP-dependent DNA ligase